MLRNAISVQEQMDILAPEIGLQEAIYNFVMVDPYGWMIVGMLSVLVAGILFMDWLDNRSE